MKKANVNVLNDDEILICTNCGGSDINIKFQRNKGRCRVCQSEAIIILTDTLLNKIIEAIIGKKITKRIK